jgi:hypothetical protein
MKDKDSAAELRDIDYSPFTHYVNANFPRAGADNGHRLPIAWFEPTLNRIQFETDRPASFLREIAQVIQA